jgi:hypothetical protein
MDKDAASLKVNVKVTIAGPDYIITTPAQLAEAFTVQWQKYKDNPGIYDTLEHIVQDDLTAVGQLSAQELIETLRELNKVG